jgi:DNA topoisomerase-3
VTTAAAPSNAAADVLQRVFGFSEFRPGQGEIVAAAEAGRDLLLVAPTGSGKSIGYWVPGIVGGGLTLVVSPLIALMNDQVARLRSLGIAAAALHSQVDRPTQDATLADARSGALRFLYVTPERFGVPAFTAARPIASPAGGTTSGPTTAGSATPRRCAAGHRSARSPRQPRRVYAATSSSRSA